MKTRQQGMTTVEAAVGTAIMMVVLFGVIEIARLVFVWNYLDTATRRGARVAAVCPFDHPAVRRTAIFAPFSPGDGLNAQSPHVRRLNTSHMNIEYLDAAGNPLEDLADTKFVRASINVDPNNGGFDLPLLMFNRVTLTPPPLSTIRPSESLGYDPDAGACRCFGEQGSGATGGCDPP